MADKRTINPFTIGLVIPYTEIITKYNDSKTEDSYKIEAESYTRVYTSKTRRLYLFSKLSMYARDMVLAMFYVTNYEYEYVILSYDKFKNLYSVSDPHYGKRRYEDTIRELHRYSIIDCKDKEKGQYWYNPAYFVTGNRLNMFPECAIRVNLELKHK